MHDDFQHRFNDFGEPPARRKWAPLAGGLALVALMTGTGYALINSVGGTAPPPPATIQQITILTPPPPPPPPLEIEPPPEPEMEEVKVPEIEPEPMAEATNDPPPGDQLGLDADGAAGSDGFGLAARKGGRGLLGGDPHAWYAGVLQRDLQAALSRDDDVRKGNYSIEVHIRVAADGTVAESRLVGSTDDPALDTALRHALAAGVRISRTPPDDLPQPIRLRISSRS